MTIKLKISKRLVTIILLVFIALVIFILIVFNFDIKKRGDRVGLQPSPTAAPLLPALDLIQYETMKLDSVWGKLTSKNYNFQIIYFTGSDIRFNRSVDRYDSYVGISFLKTKEVNSNVSLMISIHSIQNLNTLEEYVNERFNFYQNDLGKDNIILFPTKVKIGNTEGYLLKHLSGFREETHTYYLMNGQLVQEIQFVKITKGPGNFTASEKQLIQKIISSFKLIN